MAGLVLPAPWMFRHCVVLRLFLQGQPQLLSQVIQEAFQNSPQSLEALR